MEHVTYLCIWETSVDILILFVQRMFCNGEGEKDLWQLTQKLGKANIFFCLVSFSVLIVIVHACLFREEDTLVFLFEM